MTEQRELGVRIQAPGEPGYMDLELMTVEAFGGYQQWWVRLTARQGRVGTPPEVLISGEPEGNYQRTVAQWDRVLVAVSGLHRDLDIRALD